MNSISKRNSIVEIILDELRTKYPNNEFKYYIDEKDFTFITVNDEELYYSKEYGKLIGYLDMTYLLGNNIHNVGFIVQYK